MQEKEREGRRGKGRKKRIGREGNKEKDHGRGKRVRERKKTDKKGTNRAKGKRKKHIGERKITKKDRRKERETD